MVAFCIARVAAHSIWINPPSHKIASVPRQRSVCFYCLRRLTARVRCLDYVVPQVRRGGNSYRNIVSSCAECNALKGETPAEGFLRLLYRDGRLTAAELTGRLRAVEALAAGKLRPALHSQNASEALRASG